MIKLLIIAQIYLKAGASFFLGDLGGNQGIGMSFIKDFNFKTTGYETGIGFKIKKFCFELNHVYLYGADTLVKNENNGEWWRWIRRYWFHDHVFEFTQCYEFNYSKFFFRIGIGEMYFNIKHDTSTYLSNIKEKKYSLFQLIIPLVAGFNITENWSVLLNYRKTFTDYLDNVSLRGNPNNLDAYFSFNAIYNFSKKNNSLTQIKCPHFY